MSDPAPWSHPLRLADLAGRRETTFDLAPQAPARVALAAALGIDGVKKLRFSGTLMPQGRRDWALSAQLGATVVQPCVVTLDPVSTRIDTPVLRHYLAEWQEPDTSGEIEMPEDDTSESLPAILDLGAVMLEALALALPDFPRAPNAALGEAVFTESGKSPMRDEDARPFAGLTALRDTLDDKKDE